MARRLGQVLAGQGLGEQAIDQNGHRDALRLSSVIENRNEIFANLRRIYGRFTSPLIQGINIGANGRYRPLTLVFNDRFCLSC
jgi:hypothetical protein